MLAPFMLGGRGPGAAGAGDGDGFVDQPVVTTTTSGDTTIKGKVKAGSFGKFVVPLANIQAGRQYTFRYTPQFSQLAQQGKLAMVGFGFKNNNDFHIVGLRGDGSTGLHKYQVYGTPPNGWNVQTGQTTNDGGAAASGTQAGPNYLRLITSSDGTTYTLQSSVDGSTWNTEFTGQAPSPFSNVSGATTFGVALWFNNADAGPFSITIDQFADAAAIPAPVNTAAPAITGNTFIGDILSCSTGTWTGTGISYAYQWKRGGSSISGATNSTYEIQSADNGSTITCTVTASNGGGSASATSSATATVTALFNGLSPTGAWSMGRDLVAAFIGSARYTTATGVSALKDQSGNARDLAIASTTLQPLVATAGPNSRTCADFDGVDDRLPSTAALSAFIANNAGYIIASFIPDAITINNGTFLTSNHQIFGTNAANNMGLFLRNTDATVGNPDTIFALNNDGNNDVASTVAVIVGTPYVAEWKHESGNVSVRVNGGSWIDTASGNTSSLTSVLSVGGRSSDAWADMKIFEMAAFSTVPTSGTRDAIASDMKSYVGA
jgi:hypothetical protein